MSDWKPIETAPEYATVLVIHRDDLFPVSAFRIDTEWMLEREGPEDTFDRRPGKCEPLYRIPTHWMPLPESPEPAEGGSDGE